MYFYVKPASPIRVSSLKTQSSNNYNYSVFATTQSESAGNQEISVMEQ